MKWHYIRNLLKSTRTPHDVSMLIYQGHNSKTTTFRFMSLVLQLHLVMMSKYMYSKLGVDTLSSLWIMGYIIKFLHGDDNDNELAITIHVARLFLWNRQNKVLLLRQGARINWFNSLMDWIMNKLMDWIIKRLNN